MCLSRKVWYHLRDDDRFPDIKFKCLGKIVLLIWKYCRCYVEGEPIKSNISKENTIERI